MIGFIFGIISFCIVLLITAINFQNTTTLSLLVYKFENVPGIVLLYIGMILGASICIPVLITHAKKYAKEVLNRSIKNELKHLKKEEKKKKKIQNANKKKHKDKTPPIITK